MSTLTYDQLVAELFPRLTGGIRWGLERTRRLLAAVGDPQLRYPTLHVGGTNGKGSTAAVLASCLHQAGHRVGLYTSPHLCTFRERIQIEGDAISEAALLAAANRLWPTIQEEQPSFFEATTAIALLALAEAEVDVAVIEVGLGGRLDATNVITPLVTVLTNVSHDHVQYLGTTITEIAGEKAGIIKPGVPVVTGEHTGRAYDVFSARAVEVGASLHAVAPDSYHIDAIGLGETKVTVQLPSGPRTLHAPLLGPHQAANVALAVQALELLPDDWRPSGDAIARGVSAVRWPGRLQLERVAGVLWLFDVAPNVAGVDALVRAISQLQLPRPLTAVVGVLGDKEWGSMMVPLYAAADRVLLTSPPTSPPERRWDPERVLRETVGRNAEVIADFTKALERAQHDSEAAGGSVLVTGSFHTVGDALISLQLCPFGSDLALPPPDFTA